MIIKGTVIEMVRGDSEMVEVSIEDHLGNDVNLVPGDIVYFTVKTHAKTKNKEFQKVVQDFPTGTAVIRIEPEDTKHMMFGNYVYDVQLTKANGDVRTIIRCSVFKVSSEVTYE